MSVYRNYKYFLSLVPGIAVIFGNYMGGWWGISNVIFSLGVLVIVEWFMLEDKSNEKTADSFLPDAVLILHVFTQVLALTSLFLSIQLNKFSFWQLFWAAISSGIHSGSSSIVVAHEMIHRKNKMWQWMGKFLLFTAGNVYFFIEHLRVHHKWVCTDRDPASARYNESLYHFYLRTTFTQTVHAFNMEAERLKSQKQFVFFWKNYVLQNIFLQLLFCILIYYLTGKVGLIAYLLQVVMANFLLEYTNYIEHYGLRRNENERVDATHSWQSDKVISRFFLIDLSRHSDHHYYASKYYHTLNTHPNSPVLPTGYVSGIYLALLPPLWFRIVNKRIEEFIKFKKQINN